MSYLYGTVGYGLRYVSDGGVRLHEYTNCNWEGSAINGCNFYGTQYIKGRVYSNQCYSVSSSVACGII